MILAAALVPKLRMVVSVSPVDQPGQGYMGRSKEDLL